MKLNNEFLVLDLEATSVDEEVNGLVVQRNNYIIEIGAALLDRELALVDTFSQLVRPDEPILPHISEITGITPAMCKDQPLWSDVAPQLEEWVATRCKNLKTVRLSAWGNYFDMPLLRRCYEQYGLRFPFSGTCFDVKTLAMLWCSLSGRRTDKLDVKKVASVMGIKPEGDYHRALTDAVTEARILQRVFADLDGGVFVPTTNPAQPYMRLSITPE